MRRTISKPIRRAAGFTLIEAIVVIMITGIIFTMVAMFIRLPVSSAVDSSRRAALVDSADLALRRMKRELQSALPNSLRVSVDASNTVYIEFLPVLAAGRYCAAPDAGGVCSNAPGSVNDPLDFTTSDSSFEVIGPLIQQTGFNAAGSELVIFNMGIPAAAAGTPGASAYEIANADNNVAALSAIVTAGTIRTVQFSSKRFPFASPYGRFHIIGAPVSYICSASISAANGTGTLRRVTGYTKQAAQPTSFPALTGVNNATLAENVSRCESNYSQALTDRNGLLSISLQLQKENEKVTLTHEIHINNTP